MSLRPLLWPLRLLLLLLFSGVVCWAEVGPETESPVRTLQVETLVRRLSRHLPIPSYSPTPATATLQGQPRAVGSTGLSMNL